MKKSRQKLNLNWNDMGIIITLIAMIVFFSLATKSFFSLRNFSNVARQISVVGICAVGMTMVIIIEYEVDSFRGVEHLDMGSIVHQAVHPGLFEADVPDAEIGFAVS